MRIHHRIIGCQLLIRQFAMPLSTSAAMKERDKGDAPLDWDDRPGHFDTLLEAQRAWLKYRDTHCRSEGYIARGGSLEPLLVSSCKAHLTRLRTADLEELAKTY